MIRSDEKIGSRTGRRLGAHTIVFPPALPNILAAEV